MNTQDIAIIHRDRQTPTHSDTPTPAPTSHVPIAALADELGVSDRTIQRWCSAIAEEMGAAFTSPFNPYQVKMLKQVWMACGDNWREFQQATKCDRRLSIKQFCKRLAQQDGQQQQKALPTTGTVDHLEAEDSFYDLLDAGDPLQAIASEVNAITQQEAVIADALVNYLDPSQRRARILGMAAKKMQAAIGGGTAPKQLGG
jgi:hypothetical protein